MKIGLLPLYVALYDTSSPEMRPEIEGYCAEVIQKLQARGLEVLSSPVCCLESQFEAAIRAFEQSGAEALVTLHLPIRRRWNRKSRWQTPRFR